MYLFDWALPRRSGKGGILLVIDLDLDLVRSDRIILISIVTTWMDLKSGIYIDRSRKKRRRRRPR